MQRQDITQKQIADALGVTEGYISAQFGGRKLTQRDTLDTVFQITNDYEFVAELEHLANAAHMDRNPPRGSRMMIIDGEKRIVTDEEAFDFYAAAMGAV